MRAAWVWLTDHLPERVLKAVDAVPFVITTRKARARREKSAFALGRDYGRTEMGGPAVPPDRPERHLTAV